MTDALNEIKDAVQAKDFDRARTLAGAYVTANEDLLERMLGDKSLEECVSLCSFARQSQNEELIWQIEAWLLANFAPQQIGGSANLRIRRRPNG